MPAVPDEPPHRGSPDRRGQCRPDTGAACVQKQLRAYRVVKRYRGDRRAHDVASEGWADLWQLQPSDSSWPHAREG